MEGERISRSMILYAVIFLLLFFSFTALPSVEGENQPPVSHDSPEEIKVDEVKNITIEIDSDEISRVRIIWWDVDDQWIRDDMDSNDDRTWFYTIPAQEKPGKIHYWFNITTDSGDYIAYPSDYIEDIDVHRVYIVEEADFRWTNWTFILPVGGVLVFVFIFLEWSKRKMPKNYDKNEDHNIEKEKVKRYNE